MDIVFKDLDFVRSNLSNISILDHECHPRDFFDIERSLVILEESCSIGVGFLGLLLFSTKLNQEIGVNCVNVVLYFLEDSFDILQ